MELRLPLEMSPGRYLYAEYIMRNAGLEEAQALIKIAGRNINNLRFADDTTFMAESEEELKSILMKVKEDSEKAWETMPKALDPGPLPHFPCPAWLRGAGRRSPPPCHQFWILSSLLGHRAGSQDVWIFLCFGKSNCSPLLTRSNGS